MSTRSLLLEIGTEEIPARFLPRALDDLRKTVINELIIKRNVPLEEMNAPDAINTMGTPRRLAIIVNGLSKMQKDRVEEVFGPPRQAAFDKKGNPTKAAVGFAKSQGVDVKDLLIKPKEGKGEYVCAVVEHKGVPVAEVLPEALKEVIMGLPFPKSMRWGDGEIRFARPIHWIVALFGEEVVEFELDGIKSSNLSRGHRFLSPEEFAVNKPEDYVEALRSREVEVELDSREKAIREQASGLALGVGGVADADDELLSILSCLVEKPQCVLAEFSREYLSLPKELLTSVMIGHQKYIPVKGSDGNLINAFVVVSNTRVENADMVRAGAERVIRARFDDARFYFTEDRKAPLASRLDELKGVTFQDKLGTLYDKTLRLKALAGGLADRLCPEKKALVQRAAELSKCDLVSGVVFEFPELQGIMGMYYALADGEGEEVAVAIREHYLPAFSGGPVPTSEAGTVLALADRLDNLTSFFSIGLKPSGSEDPFALRRQALGIIAILHERGIQLPLRELLAPALAGLANADEVTAGLKAFFSQRVESLYPASKYDYDVVQSVMGLAMDVPLEDLASRLDALKGFREHPRYNEFLVAIKRVRNIVPDGDLPAIEPSLFGTEEEKALYAASGRTGKAVTEHSSDHAFALGELVTLTEPIDSFFDKVLVMDKDEKLRNNRLALLREVWGLAASLADFSRLQERQ